MSGVVSRVWGGAQWCAWFGDAGINGVRAELAAEKVRKGRQELLVEQAVQIMNEALDLQTHPESSSIHVYVSNKHIPQSPVVQLPLQCSTFTTVCTHLQLSHHSPGYTFPCPSSAPIHNHKSYCTCCTGR